MFKNRINEKEKKTMIERNRKFTEPIRRLEYMEKPSNSYVTTSFKCPLELRDKIEQIINEHNDVYSPDEIMIKIIKNSFEKGFDL